MICFPTSLHRRMSGFFPHVALSSCESMQISMFPKHPRIDDAFTLFYLTFLLSLPFLNGQHRMLYIWERHGFCTYSRNTANCTHSGVFIPKEWGRTYHCVKWSAEIDTGDSIIQSPSAGAQPAWAAWREWWQQAMMTVPAQGLSGFWSGVGAPPFWSRTAVSQHPNISRPIRGSASLMEIWKKFGQLSTFSVVALSRELQVSHVIVLLVLCLLPKKVAWILWLTCSCWASQLSGQPGWLPSAPWLSPGCWGWISVGGFPSHCGVC